MPRTDSDKVEPRPIEFKASDVDILLELNPDNRVNKISPPSGLDIDRLFIQQQTILTLGIMDLVLTNMDHQGNAQRFLSLTSPRSLVRLLLIMISQIPA